MAWKGIKHISVGDGIEKTEWEGDELHEIDSGATLPESPNNYDLFLKTDEGRLYIYIP